MANGSYPTSTSLAETQDECSPRRFFSKHASAVSLYVARILVALVVLCLDAYAIHLSGDLAMVYSLVLVCNPLHAISSQTTLAKSQIARPSLPFWSARTRSPVCVSFGTTTT